MTNEQRTNSNNLESEADKFEKAFILVAGTIGLGLGAAIGFNNYSPDSPELYSYVGHAFHAIEDALMGGSLGAMWLPVSKGIFDPDSPLPL